MSGIRKENKFKSVPEECDEWLTTRNKRKASPFQKPVKKHKASSTPLREITRDNQPFLLTQNSPPPPQLKTCTKQSDIKSFFKAPNKTDHQGQVKAPVQLIFKDDDEIISSDNSDQVDLKENQKLRSQDSHQDRGSIFSRKQIQNLDDDSDEDDLKENLNLGSQNRGLDKENIFLRKQIQNLDDEESKPQYVEFERNKRFNPLHKNDTVINSPFERSKRGTLIEQCAGSKKTDLSCTKPVHGRDLLLKDIPTERSLLSSNREEVHHMSSSSIGKYGLVKNEMDQKLENLEQKQKLYKRDCGFTETEFSVPDTCSVASNKNSKKQRLTCDRSTCPVCCDVLSESLTCSCDYTETATDQSSHSHLINSEEADQELDNFSLSLNTHYFT